MKKILVIHGPNINLTGTREPGVYGQNTISEINDEIVRFGNNLGFIVDIYQSNSEGEIISKIHSALHNDDGIILNAGAYTHYSYAIADALSAVKLPAIEVHFSNIHAREEFRRKSVLAPSCVGMIAGFGKNSYLLALSAMKTYLEGLEQ